MHDSIESNNNHAVDNELLSLPPKSMNDWAMHVRYIKVRGDDRHAAAPRLQARLH